MKLSISLLVAGLAVSVQSHTINGAKVTEILATALPASLLSLAIKNPAKASSVISSEFAAGETPAWFSKLPHGVQTYLVPATTKHTVAPTMPPISPMSGVRGVNGTNMTTPTHITTKKQTTTMGGGGTTVGKTSTKIVSPPSQSASKPSGKPASVGAPLDVPVALLTSGLLGAVGLVGMLAL